MNKIIVIIIILTVGWYGNILYKNNELPFIQNTGTNLDSNEKVKCITKDGRVLYGSVPEGTICERRESVEGSITIVPGVAVSSTQGSAQDSSRFSCDGRQHCSQMTSRAEAEFFIKNCPNTKMDGDNDGVPCESDSRF